MGRGELGQEAKEIKLKLGKLLKALNGRGGKNIFLQNFYETTIRIKRQRSKDEKKKKIDLAEQKAINKILWLQVINGHIIKLYESDWQLVVGE